MNASYVVSGLGETKQPFMSVYRVYSVIITGKLGIGNKELTLGNIRS
jgi:hypothetical protein